MMCMKNVKNVHGRLLSNLEKKYSSIGGVIIYSVCSINLLNLDL